MKRLLLFILIAVQALNNSAQVSADKDKLQVAGFIGKGKVLLRWSPENSITWKFCNKSGYMVYRKTVVKDGKVVEKPDSTFLGVYKPLPLDSWEPFADSSYYAVAAEAIYGKEFEVTSQSSNFFDWVNKSREQESRFSMGLVCADQSFAVACMMGLGMIDTTVRMNESYLYTVFSNHADSSREKVLGFTFIDFKYGNFLPRPFGLTHQVSGSVVTIMAPFAPFKGIYASYELQRSDDGRVYRTVKGKSYYSMSTSPDDPEYNIYTDSVDLKASTIYYRLRGRTPFDAYGQFSDTLTVKIMPLLNGDPWITNILEVEGKNLFIYWRTPSYSKENLKGFMVYSSKNYEGPYSQHCRSSIETEVDSVAIEPPNGYAYFKVAAIDQFDRPYFSAPMLYQAVDSIPPSAPVGLKGSFDTTGVVSLRWSYGKEPDLLCYQVLYSANINSEFSLIDKTFIHDSTYKASFSTDMLSSDIYFKVVALDNRYNTSKPSDPLKLVKPDRIPPSSPVLVVNTDSTGLFTIFVAPSSSNDIKQHYLYFTPESDEQNPILVYKGCIKSDTTFSIAQDYNRGRLYCVAEDVTGRRSSSNQVYVKQNISDQKSILKVSANPLVDDGVVELQWDKSKVSGSVMIYRNNDEKGFRLIATVDSKVGVYRDGYVAINTDYSYKLVAFNLDGKAISRVVKVRYL